MVDKQRKNALKQASLVLERFIEQFVVDVDFTGLPLDIGIKGNILNQFKAHLTGKLLHIPDIGVCYDMKGSDTVFCPIIKAPQIAPRGL